MIIVIISKSGQRSGEYDAGKLYMLQWRFILLRARRTGKIKNIECKNDLFLATSYLDLYIDYYALLFSGGGRAGGGGGGRNEPLVDREKYLVWGKSTGWISPSGGGRMGKCSASGGLPPLHPPSRENLDEWHLLARSW